MAERRMFAKSIVLSDTFLDMPMSARCLYFTLGMLADDDGFVGNPKAIMRQCGASQDDLQILFAKKYVLGFESGVIVIKHWRINNFLRNDRHHETAYVEEKSNLDVDEKGCYFETEKQHLLEFGIPSDNQVGDKRYTEVRLGKVIKEKVDISNDISPKKKSFTRPTYEEVIPEVRTEGLTGLNDQEKARRFMTSFNSIEGVKTCMKMTCSREMSIAGLLSEFSEEDIDTVFRKIRESDWLTGKAVSNGRTFHVYFDWILDKGNFLKILEGVYDNSNLPLGRQKRKDYSDVKPEDLDTSNFSWEV